LLTLTRFECTRERLKLGECMEASANLSHKRTRKTGIYEVRPEHMAVFGAIVRHFARHEYLMQGIMCALLKVPFSKVTLLTSGLGYSGKREALLSLLRDVEIEENTRDRVRSFVGELHKHNQLRNHVAHSMWKEGTRANSIKPIGADARQGRAKFIGHDPTEEDYLLDELVNVANELGRNFDSFRNFLDSVGLMREDSAYKART
jgi:hypothetical protein